MPVVFAGRMMPGDVAQTGSIKLLGLLDVINFSVSWMWLIREFPMLLLRETT